MPGKGRLFDYANEDRGTVSKSKAYTDASLRRRVQLPETEVLDTYGVPYEQEFGSVDRALREAKDSLKSTEALSRSLQQARNVPTERPYQSPPARMAEWATTSLHPQAEQIRELIQEVDQQPMAHLGETPLSAQWRGFKTGAAKSIGEMALGKTSPFGLLMEAAPFIPESIGALRNMLPGVKAAKNAVGRPAADLAPDLWSKAPSRGLPYQMAQHENPARLRSRIIGNSARTSPTDMVPAPAGVPFAEPPVPPVSGVPATVETGGALTQEGPWVKEALGRMMGQRGGLQRTPSPAIVPELAGMEPKLVGSGSTPSVDALVRQARSMYPQTAEPIEGFTDYLPRVLNALSRPRTAISKAVKETAPKAAKAAKVSRRSKKSGPTDVERLRAVLEHIQSNPLAPADEAGDVFNLTRR